MVKECECVLRYTGCHEVVIRDGGCGGWQDTWVGWWLWMRWRDHDKVVRKLVTNSLISIHRSVYVVFLFIKSDLEPKCHRGTGLSE